MLNEEKREWYTFIDCAQKGPVSIEEVKELLFSGQIDENTLVRKHTKAQWKKLKQFTELSDQKSKQVFDNFKTQRIRMTANQTGGVSKSVAVFCQKCGKVKNCQPPYENVYCSFCGTLFLYRAKQTMKILCPCGKRLSLRGENAGKPGKCPNCKSPLEIPLFHKVLLCDEQEKKCSTSVPIFITLIGNSAVGKSYYLFALGLSLRKLYSFRNQTWIIEDLSDDYQNQLDIWLREHQQGEKISANDLGDNVQLSFTIKNKLLNRSYEVIFADMAGEDIIRYLKGESIFKRIANDIRMRVKLSSGIMLMVDSTKLDDDFEINAWLELLKTGLFNSLDVCLTKADVLEPVEQKLKQFEGVAHLTDDSSLEEYAEEEFSSPKVKPILEYLREQSIDARFHYVSAIGLTESDLPQIHQETGAFLGYNIFKPILDILENVEKNFNNNYIATLLGKIKNLKWASTLKKAVHIYHNKQFRAAVEKLYNEDLIKDTHHYYDVLKKFNKTLKYIHSSWIKEYDTYKNASPAIDTEGVLNRIILYYREVIDKKTLEIEVSKYSRKINADLQKILPRGSTDFAPAVQCVHEQYKAFSNELRRFKKFYKVIPANDESIQRLKELISNYITQQSKNLVSKIGKSSHKVLVRKIRQHPENMEEQVMHFARALTFYTSTWKTGIKLWREVLTKDFGEPSEMGNYLEKITDTICKTVNSTLHYSVGFQMISVLEDSCTDNCGLLGIPNKLFSNRYLMLNNLRCEIFTKIPQIEKMSKLNRSTWYFNDALFEVLHDEWYVWKSGSTGYLPPKNLHKRFPHDLLICPGCEGQRVTIRKCSCSQRLWAVRTLHLYLFRCKNCRGKGQIVNNCKHCNGSGSRMFAAQKS